MQSRERYYNANRKGCYTFYFTNPVNNKLCCIDSTAETDEYGYGRLINHSKVKPNCKPVVITENNVHRPTQSFPRLVFIANQNINKYKNTKRKIKNFILVFGQNLFVFCFFFLFLEKNC